MGIQDRDYYRNEGPSIFDSLMPTGQVCRWLIGINVGVFVLQLLARNLAAPADDQLRVGAAASGWVTEWLILDVQAVLRGEVWRLLTYSFLHSTDNLYHILFNMIFLWWFGSDVEQLYGRSQFLAIYLLSALMGGVAYEGWSVFRGESIPCLGASGAVTTMLVLCALHFPRRIIYVFLVLPVPIWLFAIVNVAQDFYMFLSDARKSDVAVVVHLAGAAFAVAYYKWQRDITQVAAGWLWWKRTRSRARLKLFNPELEREEPVAVAASVSSVVLDEHLEAKLDAVLIKIKRTGKESLTKQEQEVLRQAAEMYKRRRH